VLASEPGTPARESRIDRRGLFSLSLEVAARDLPDGPDGRGVSLEAAFATARQIVVERAERAGVQQMPVIVGVLSGELAIARKRR
jgi:hypothetical protein